MNKVKILKFVVRKKPKGVKLIQSSDGTAQIIYEVTQEEMNDLCDNKSFASW